MPSFGDLIAKLTLDATNFNAGVDSAMGKLDAFGGSAIKAGGILTAAVTAPLVGIGIAAFKAAIDFDEAADKIRAATGATGPALDSLTASFTSVFKSVPAGTAEVATAISDLTVRTDLTGTALEAMATQMLNLARVSEEEIGPLIEATTRLFGSWKIATEDQSGALDYLYKVSQATGIGVGDLAGKLVTMGPTLQTLGFDFTTAAALLGSFEQAGVNADVAFAALKKGLATLAKEGISDPAEALPLLIQRVKDAGSEGEAAGIAISLFGAKAGPELATAIRSGKLSVDDLLTSLSASGETINKAAADTLSFGEKWTLFKNNLEAALVPLGEVLLNALTKLMEIGQPLIAWLESTATWFSQLDPAIQAVGLAIAVAVAAIGPLLIALGGMALGLSSILALIGGGAGLLAILGFLWPIIAGVALAWAGWKLTEWLLGFPAVQAAFEFLFSGLEKLWSWLMLIPGAAAAFEAVKGAVTGVKDSITGAGKAADTAGTQTDKLTAAEKLLATQLAAVKKINTDLNAQIDAMISGHKEATKHVQQLTKDEQALRVKLLELNSATQDAIRKTEDFDDGIITISGHIVFFGEEALELAARLKEIGDEAYDVSRAVIPMGTDIQNAIGLAQVPVNKLGEAMTTLGLDSIAAKATIATNMAAARDEVLGSNIPTDFQKKTAIYIALKAQIDAATEAGTAIPASQIALLTQLETDLNLNKQKIVGPWQAAFAEISAAVTTSVNSVIDRMIGLESGSVLDALKDLGRDVLSIFIQPFKDAIDDLIQNGLKKLVGWITGAATGSEGGVLGALDDLGSSIWNALSGGGGSAAGSTADLSGYFSGITGSGQAVGGVAGGIVSAGLAGTIGAVGAAVSAVSGVIGNFQMHGMNVSLGRIEENTRVTAIALIGTRGVIDNQNLWLPNLKDIHDMLFSVIHIDLVNIAGKISETLDWIKMLWTAPPSWTAELATAGAGAIAVNLYIDGQQVTESVMSRVVYRMRTEGQQL